MDSFSLNIDVCNYSVKRSKGQVSSANRQTAQEDSCENVQPMSSVLIWTHSLWSPAPLVPQLLGLLPVFPPNVLPDILLHIHQSLHRPLREQHSLPEMAHTMTTSKFGSFIHSVLSCQTPSITRTPFTATGCVFRWTPGQNNRPLGS